MKRVNESILALCMGVSNKLCRRGPTFIAMESYSFVIFGRGGGGPDTLSPTGSAHIVCSDNCMDIDLDNSSYCHDILEIIL